MTARLIGDLRLGVRLCRGAGPLGLARAALMAGGAATATFVLLTAASLNGLADRQQERADLVAPKLTPTPGTTGIPGAVVGDSWNNQELRRVVIGPGGDPAVSAPGVARLPKPGEVVMSPALARLADREATVAERFPQRHIGVIAKEGLVEPDQLLAYVGVSRADLRPEERISGFGGGAAGPQLSPGNARTLAALFGLLLVGPVAMLSGACARLSATARAERLAALRLLGLTPMRTQLANAVEAGLSGAAGSVGGVGAWFAWRAVVPEVRIGAFSWFSDSMQVSVPLIATVLVGQLVLTLLVGWFGARRAVRDPLQVRRERSVRSVSPWRLVPGGLGVGLLGWSWVTAAGRRGEFVDWLLPFGFGVVGLGAGVPLVVPYVAQMVGRMLRRSGRPARLLAGRRLLHEPAVAGRLLAVAGFALVAAGFGQVVMLDVRSVWVDTALPDDRPFVLPITDATGHSLTSFPSSRAVLQQGDLAGGTTVWFATCAELRASSADPVSGCRDGEVQRLRLQPVAEFAMISAEPPPTTSESSLIDADVAAQGLPIPVGEVRYSTYGPNGAGGTPDIIAPPRFAQGLRTEAIVAFDGATFDQDAALAHLASVRPTATFNPLIGFVDRLDTPRLYASVVGAGSVVAIILGMLSIVIATIDNALERRQGRAHLLALGTPARVLRNAAVWQILPVGAVVLPIAGAGALLGSASYLRWGDSGLSGIGVTIGLLTGVSVASAALAALVAAALTPRHLDPRQLRHE